LAQAPKQTQHLTARLILQFLPRISSGAQIRGSYPEAGIDPDPNPPWYNPAVSQQIKLAIELASDINYLASGVMYRCNSSHPKVRSEKLFPVGASLS
jgi:hypothetical protein